MVFTLTDAKPQVQLWGYSVEYFLGTYIITQVVDMRLDMGC
jgi:hypothetical protein